MLTDFEDLIMLRPTTQASCVEARQRNAHVPNSGTAARWAAPDGSLAVAARWPAACVTLRVERRAWSWPHGSTDVALADTGHLIGGRMLISARPTRDPATLPGPAPGAVEYRAVA